MNKNIIPVAMITDEKIPFTVATAIISILENANPDVFFNFHCFITGSVKNDDRSKILSIQDYFNNCTIELIDLKDRYLSCDNRHETVTNACLYKFAIADTLTQYDKILYLDTDILVNGDLSELYNIELFNNYIGGVFNIFFRFHKTYLTQMLDIPDLDSYINAGVMLMNLKLIRENNITEELEKYIGKFQDSVDQHIFNKVCYGRILNIHPKYNVTIKYIELYETEKAEIFYTKSTIEETIKRPLILHYTGIRKPWMYNDISLAGKWHYYYKKSPYKEINLDRKPLIKPSPKGLFNVYSFFRKVSNFIFKAFKHLNFIFYKKYRICSDYYKYFIRLNLSKKNKFSNRTLIVTDGSESEEFLSFLNKLKEKDIDLFILRLKKNKSIDFANSNTFKFNKFSRQFIFSLRYFRTIILNGAYTYKLANILNLERIPYLWNINNKTIIEKNIKIQKIIEETKSTYFCTQEDLIQATLKNVRKGRQYKKNS